SVYRATVNVDNKTGEEKFQDPWTATWLPPSAIEITVIQHPRRPRFHPDDVARLVGTLQSEYGHYGRSRPSVLPAHDPTGPSSDKRQSRGGAQIWKPIQAQVGQKLLTILISLLPLLECPSATTSPPPALGRAAWLGVALVGGLYLVLDRLSDPLLA
nr:hypothetical protein [Tanacetum cinerariifolium]